MARLDSDFLDNLGRYRKYRPDSLRDILRVIRNKHNHFRELPDHLQAKLGPLPDGFLRSARGPGLFCSRFLLPSPGHVNLPAAAVLWIGNLHLMIAAELLKHRG